MAWTHAGRQNRDFNYLFATFVGMLFKRPKTPKPCKNKYKLNILCCSFWACLTKNGQFRVAFWSLKLAQFPKCPISDNLFGLLLDVFWVTCGSHFDVQICSRRSKRAQSLNDELQVVNKSNAQNKQTMATFWPSEALKWPWIVPYGTYLEAPKNSKKQETQNNAIFDPFLEPIWTPKLALKPSQK